jgi:hypothetical protein
MSSQDTEPLVYVEWVDSSGHDGWAPRNELADQPRPSTCRTAGIVVAENDQALTIVQSVDDTHDHFQLVHHHPALRHHHPRGPAAGPPSTTMAEAELRRTT